MYDLLNVYFGIQIGSYKKHCLFKEYTKPAMDHFFIILLMFESKGIGLELVTSDLHPFCVYIGKIFPTLRIDENLP